MSANELDLLDSLNAKNINAAYTLANPCPANRFSFRPESVSSVYEAWPAVGDIAEIDPLLGLNENRGGSLQDVEKTPLEARIKLFFDASLSWHEYAATATCLTAPKARFDPQDAREKAIKTEKFDPVKHLALHRSTIGYTLVLLDRRSACVERTPPIFP